MGVRHRPEPPAVDGEDHPVNVVRRRGRELRGTLSGDVLRRPQLSRWNPLEDLPRPGLVVAELTGVVGGDVPRSDGVERRAPCGAHSFASAFVSCPTQPLLAAYQGTVTPPWKESSEATKMIFPSPRSTAAFAPPPSSRASADSEEERVTSSTRRVKRNAAVVKCVVASRSQGTLKWTGSGRRSWGAIGDLGSDRGTTRGLAERKLAEQASQGVDLSGAQATKTRKALEFFATEPATDPEYGQAISTLAPGAR